jgi:hypothetical protein
VRWRSLLEEINIKLWRHLEEQDWSADIHGRLHEHITTQTVDELVEYFVVAAQQLLLKPEAALEKSAIPANKPPQSSLAKAGTSGIHMLKR